jgi:hypothetical protein
LVLAGKRFNMHSKISRAISIPAMWWIPLFETPGCLRTEQSQVDYILHAHITHLGENHNNGITNTCWFTFFCLMFI